MTKKLLLACLLVTIGAAQGCGDDTSDGNASDDVCAQACETAEALKCAGDQAGTCNAECLKLWNQARCGAETQAFIECTANTPEANWECDADDNEANVKAGHCETDLNAVIACAAQP